VSAELQDVKAATFWEARETDPLPTFENSDRPTAGKDWGEGERTRASFDRRMTGRSPCNARSG
jgi:hypothetical protein